VGGGAGLLRVCGRGWVGAGGLVRVRTRSLDGSDDRRSRRSTVV